MGRGSGSKAGRIILAAALLCAAAGAPAEQRELSGMDVIGNRELPKGLYILPWQRAQGEGEAPRPQGLAGDDALGPLDPDVFRRELEYHQALQEHRGQ